MELEPSLVVPGPISLSSSVDEVPHQLPNLSDVAPVQALLQESFSFLEIANEISNLNLICLSMGEDYILVHRPKFDMILEGEPFQTLQIVIQLSNKEYLVRVWGQTHLKGRVESVHDMKNLCAKFFTESHVCSGLPSKISKRVKVISYPVRRFLSRDCLKLIFGTNTRCSACADAFQGTKHKLEPKEDFDDNTNPVSSSHVPEVKLEVEGEEEEYNDDEKYDYDPAETLDQDSYQDYDDDDDEEEDESDVSGNGKKDEALASKIEEVIRNHEAPIIKNEDLPKGEFRCNECNKEYKNFGCLSNHQRKVHGRSADQLSPLEDLGEDKGKRYRFKHYSCDICHKPFESKLLCLEHRTSHTGEKLFYCEECGKGFGFLSSYKYHVRIHMRAKGMLTDNSSNSLYHFCEHCGKKFSDKHCLTNHINNQHLKRMTKIPCSVCGVMCQSRNQLLVHMNRKHRTDGRYQCNTCGKRFGAKNTLDRHQLVHNEPQLECKFCGKKVKKMENLLNHERIHTGETPFKCPNCQLGFRSRPALCLHKRTHCKVEQKPPVQNQDL